MQESCSHISQILLRSVNKSMCKRVQLLCVSKFENYKSIKSQLPKVWVISAIKGCFVKGIYIKMPGSLKCDIWFGSIGMAILFFGIQQY